MPLYEYCCERCQHRFELLESMSASSEEARTCPACGADAARRVPSLFGSRGESPVTAASPGGG
jgi:putative FmdB family regulatory protein